MKKSEDVKEKIIEVTIRLIRKSKGEVADISTRKIAETAGVGIGLINYHFQTKESLIDICVERIIGGVISAFKPADLPLAQTPAERLKHTAKLVADFLWDNPEVSRISILSDCKTPKKDDNTIKSAQGFCHSLSSANIPDNEKLVLVFTLTTVMQALFLRKEQIGELFGYNVNMKEQRDMLLDLLIEKLFGGLNG